MPGLDASASRALKEAGARSLLLVAALASFELVIRTACGAARFPDAATAALDVGAHIGRVAVLLPIFVLADVAWSAAASIKHGAVAALAVGNAVAWLCRPPRALRGLVFAVLACVVLALTVGRKSQLPWHAGGAYAGPTVFVFALGEIAVAWRRREPRPERFHPIGIAIWAGAIGLLATLVVSFVGFPLLGAGATAGLLFVGTRATLTFARVRGAGLLVGFAAAIALVALDVRRPELRRFDAAYTPFAVLGRTLLATATDLDGDGASGLVGLDCDDTDPRSGPLQTDLPDDGIDQNCRGGDGDLARALSRYEPGGIYAQRRPVARARKPSVFLVTVDAWRADVFDAATLPATFAWAESCFRFTNARSNVPFTGPSLISLHTGVFARHVTNGDDWAIALAAPDRGLMSIPPTLAAALAINGKYQTTVVFPPFHVQNFSFLTGYEGGETLPDTGTAEFPSADTALAKARAELAGMRPNEPVHLRVHLMDLHTPYKGGGTSRTAYLRSVRELDAPLAAFLRELPKDAIVVLSADHGEALNEHGWGEHGHTLFDEELRVPLVLCAPPDAELGAPRVIAAPVSLVDVTPTLLEMTGVDAPYRRHGESLVPLLRGGERRRAWVFAENPAKDQQAIILGCDKWIEDAHVGWTALFDVCADPEERRDIARTAPERADRMKRLLDEVVDLDLDAIRSWRIGRRLLQ